MTWQLYIKCNNKYLKLNNEMHNSKRGMGLRNACDNDKHVAMELHAGKKKRKRKIALLKELY